MARVLNARYRVTLATAAGRQRRIAINRLTLLYSIELNWCISLLNYKKMISNKKYLF